MRDKSSHLATCLRLMEPHSFFLLIPKSKTGNCFRRPESSETSRIRRTRSAFDQDEGGADLLDPERHPDADPVPKSDGLQGHQQRHGSDARY